jgi:hypothetical protein
MFRSVPLAAPTESFAVPSLKLYLCDSPPCALPAQTASAATANRAIGERPVERPLCIFLLRFDVVAASVSDAPAELQVYLSSDNPKSKHIT